jgi:hypothetical protein
MSDMNHNDVVTNSVRHLIAPEFLLDTKEAAMRLKIHGTTRKLWRPRALVPSEEA